jgi:hypothetical protein
LICPAEAIKWSKGALIPLKVTETPAKLVAGKPVSWSTEPKEEPKTLAKDPGASGVLAAKVAPLTTALIAGGLGLPATGSVSVWLVAPPIPSAIA